MNKRGGAIVESVLIFPLVVMSVVSLIFIMIYFHEQLCDRVDMHIRLRAESGEICENMVYYNETDDEITVYRETQQIYSKSSNSFNGKLILNEKHTEISARKHLIDEGRFVRMAGIIEYEK